MQSGHGDVRMTPEADSTWRVLIVEDEALVASAVRDSLTALGHEVLGVTGNGEQALELAERLRPQLVLMDIHLEGTLDGIETANRIHARLGVPVIFASGNTDSDTLRRADNGAVFGYLIKPFRQRDLKLVLQLAMARYHAEASLTRSQLTHATILSSIADGVVVTDPQDIVRFVNPAALQLLGCTLTEALDHPLEQVVTLQDENTGHAAPVTPGTGRSSRLLANWSGRRLAVDVEATLVLDHTGQRNGTAILLRDVTDKRTQEEFIWRQANYDAVTSLPNRNLFQARLQSEIERSRASGKPLALLLLDLDNFKEINDALGHDKGDQLLRSVARRLQSCIRGSDVLARLGGDEFTIILPGIVSRATAEQAAKWIFEELGKPFEIGGNQFHVGTSIGIAIYPDDTTRPEDLLRFADQAMYVAKAEGRSRAVHFTPSMQASTERRRRLVSDLHQALPRGELALHYQPIVDLATRAITKAEALLRWTHPERGSISPLEFIPVAEDCGLIHEIGEWVFDQAVRMAGRLETLGYPLQISVNASPVQFAPRAPTAMDWSRKLAELRIPRSRIAVEITESVMMADAPEVRERLLEFRNNGIEVAIDDFGTGFSSLSYLRRFDIDYLKVDASFTRGLVQNADDRALTEAIIVMARKLGLHTIAEGVETEEQRAILAQFGCSYAQGYLFSRPLPAADFERLLTAR